MASAAAIAAARRILSDASEADLDSAAEAIEEETLVVKRAERVIGRCLSLFQHAERHGFDGTWIRNEIRLQLDGEDLCEAGLPPINNMRAHEVLDTLVDLQHEDRLARRTGMACSPPAAYV